MGVEIVAAWYFTDEQNTLIGPYPTEADARRSSDLYERWTSADLTRAEGAEVDAMNERAAKLAAWIRMGR